MLTCALYECGIPVARDSDLCPRHAGEAETVARIAAWLRAEAKRLGQAKDAEVSTYGPPFTHRCADAIERGDWRNGGDNRG